VGWYGFALIWDFRIIVRDEGWLEYLRAIPHTLRAARRVRGKVEKAKRDMVSVAERLTKEAARGR
jgi:hypothetical protein